MRIIISFIILLGFVFLSPETRADRKKSNEEKCDTSIVKVVYQYFDSSVPPIYHRSYSIVVNESSAHVIVDSYGDILADKRYPVSRTQFDSLLCLINESGIRNCKMEENKGCDGGTGEQIQYYSVAGKLFSGYVSHCAGDDSGDLCGAYDKLADRIKKLIPDLSQLRE